MAQVPMQDLPTQQMTTQGPGEIRVNAQVEPVKNYAPEQAEKFGQALQKAGNTMTDIGSRLQAQFDDTRAKEAANVFADNMERLELEYQQQRGRNAVTSFDSVQARIAQMTQEFESSLDNDMQRQLFRARASVRSRATIGTVVRHSISEQRSYANAESQAEVDGFIRAGQAAWSSWQEPDGDFERNRLAAIRSLDQYAANNGIPQESAQYQERRRAIDTAMHTGVLTGMINENQWVQARDYLEDRFQAGEIDGQTYRAYLGQIDTGFRRANGTAVADQIYDGLNAGTRGSTFDQAVNQVLAFEGGYVADDAGAGPTNMGINSQANPDVDVASLTVDGAKELYRTRYWNAIDADNLPASIRLIAFDTAVNMGPGAARELIQQSGGDFNRFLELRRARYEAIIAADPTKEQYRAGWMNRLDTLARQHGATAGFTDFTGTEVAGRAGQPNLAEMLRTARATIRDPDELQYAEARITARYNEGVQLQEENYRSAAAAAQEVAWDTPGRTWRDVPTEIWSQLKPEDRARIIEGPTRGDEPDLVLEMMRNPTMTLPGNVEQYRMRLSESTYRQMVAAGLELQSNPNTVNNVTIDNEIFDSVMVSNDMFRYVNPSNDTDRQAAIQLRRQYEQRLVAERNRTGRDASYADKERILQQIITDTVYLREMGRDPQRPFFQVSRSDMETAYVPYTGTRNPNVPRGTEIMITSIPETIRAGIVNALLDDGQVPTQVAIMNRWVDDGMPGATQEQLDPLNDINGP